MTAPIAIIMGSQSDWETMRHAADTLAALGVPCDTRIVSAHRTPDRLYAFAKGAKAAGHQVIIAGAGGAAHLPGMTAALTELPVFGVPVESLNRSASGISSSTIHKSLSWRFRRSRYSVNSAGFSESCALVRVQPRVPSGRGIRS